MNKTMKTILSALVILISCGMLFALSKQAGIRNKVEDVKPPLFDTPSYVELNENDPLLLSLTAKEDAHLGSLSVVLVNTDTKGDGTIVFELRDSSEALVFCQGIVESDVPIGEWYEIGNPDFYIEKGDTYTLFIEAEGCRPYFIKTQSRATDAIMPFEELVFKTDSELTGLEPYDLSATGCGISLGASIISDEPLYYHEIFSFSRLFVVLTAICLLMLIIIGKDETLAVIRRLSLDQLFKNIGNEIFLVILFALLCCSIYINGYLEGINISADSAGYLREAVNMAAGRGFHFDSLAGYNESWFANWPILYPLMIAAVMKITAM